MYCCSDISKNASYLRAITFCTTILVRACEAEDQSLHGPKATSEELIRTPTTEFILNNARRLPTRPMRCWRCADVLAIRLPVLHFLERIWNRRQCCFGVTGFLFLTVFFVLSQSLQSKVINLRSINEPERTSVFRSGRRGARSVRQLNSRSSERATKLQKSIIVSGQ